MMDLTERRALEEVGRLHSEACRRMHLAEGRARRLEKAVLFLVGAVGVLLFMLLGVAVPGCAPAGEPWPVDGRCAIECLDPAYPVICEVERPSEVVWTCTVDGDACKAVPGLVCTP